MAEPRITKSEIKVSPEMLRRALAEEAEPTSDNGHAIAPSKSDQNGRNRA